MQKNDNSCGCCKGISVDIPVQIYNRPGLESISYRAGNYSKFYQSLLARITNSGQPALKNLTTREQDDYTIALFDAWSQVADILTFYQERIANESYLRTATERLSVLELARLIGYELSPGVAASTYIAFILEDTPGAFTLTQDSTAETIPPVTLNSGIQIQSIPGPDEQAQIFETLETVEARPAWNEIKPLLTQNQQVNSSSELLYIDGITSNCAKGDILLLKNTGNFLKKAVEVTTDTENNATIIKFQDDAQLPAFNAPKSLTRGKIDDYKDITDLSQEVLEDILSKEWYDDDLFVLISLKQWSENDFTQSVTTKLSSTDDNDGDAYIFRKQSFLFGNNAMKQVTYNSSTRNPDPPSSWTEWDLNETAGNIYLDDTNKEIMPESFIAIQNTGVDYDDSDIYTVDSATIKSRTEYGLSAKTTHIKFSPASTWWPPKTDTKDMLSQIRSTTVYCQSEKLTLQKLPVEDYVSGDLIALNGLILGLQKEQNIIVSGEILDPAGVVSSELMQIKQVKIKEGITYIQLKSALKYTYLRSECKIYANVVMATHGETVEEILGSGKATKKFQRFTLKHTPLTYISSAESSSGVESTLEIRVNDILWEEVESFYDSGPLDRVYVTKTDNDSKTTVIFGDGITGSRLPGGTDNVKARYRKGTGLSGVLKKNQISQLLTKPLGVKSANNPIVSSGGADQEVLSEARRNAPKSILTLDRVVSLKDYEDYAQSFAGIGKALATWSWVNGQKCVFITVAGPEGVKIEKSSTVYLNLLKSLKNYGNPHIKVFIDSYKPKYFKIDAKIEIKSEYTAGKVLTEIEDNLRTRFSFDNMQFGQTVSYSEVVSEINKVEGVQSVDLDAIYFSDQQANSTMNLKASLPVPGYDKIEPAELITLDTHSVNLSAL